MQQAAKRNIPQPPSKAEATLELQLRAYKVRGYVREHRFHPPRRWRFDFAFPEIMFAVEVEGITPGGGRHQRMQGFENDLEKYQFAMGDGWNVYRCSPSMIKSGKAIEFILEWLKKYQ